MEDFARREDKLKAAKDIVAAYVSKGGGENGGGKGSLSPDEVCEFFRKMYATIDETVPGRQERSIGLGG